MASEYWKNPVPLPVAITACLVTGISTGAMCYIKGLDDGIKKNAA